MICLVIFHVCLWIKITDDMFVCRPLMSETAVDSDAYVAVWFCDSGSVRTAH